jgi:hypothetical protein
MTYTTVKNPRWANAENTSIDVDVFFIHLNEEVPFGASPNDIVAHGREIYQRCVDGEFGPIAPYVRDVNVEWNMVRNNRYMLLKSCDWTQFTDAQTTMSEEKKVAWAVYRQALRDIPQSFADPADVVWPSKPA